MCSVRRATNKLSRPRGEVEVMHIGLVIGGNQIGGMERQAFLLACGLHDRGIRVSVFFSGRPCLGLNRRDHTISFSPLPTYWLWGSRYTNSPSAYYLAWLLRRLGVSVVQAYQLSAIEKAKRAIQVAGGLPYIACVRGTRFAFDASLADKYKNACANAVRVLCNCTTVRELLLENQVCSRDRLLVFPNGIAIRRVCSPGKSDRGFNILFAATLKAVKDPVSFAKAVALVMRQKTEVTVTIAGEGSLRTKMRRVFEDQNVQERVSFLGQVPMDSVPYAQADLVVSSSIREASSNTILEAFASGVPVVATSVGGSVELRGMDFVRLVPPRDELLLAKAIMDFARLSQERRLELGLGASDYVRKNYSIDSMVDNHIALYKAVS